MITKSRAGRQVKRMALLAASLAVLLAATGCAALVGPSASEPWENDVHGGYSGGRDLAVTEAAPPTDFGGDGAKMAGYDASTVPEADRLVIRNQTLRLEVASVRDAVDSVRALAKTHGAIVTDLQVATEDDGWLYRYDQYGSGDGTALRGWVTVRVPADSLAAFVEGASALGTVKYQAESSEDVTQQHIDLSARLENLRAQEKRLREFFEKATKVEEMLAIEQELARVRGEIESMDAQVVYLERQAAMASVTIELTEPRAIVRPNGDDWGFRDAITNGIRGAAGVVTIAIVFFIATSPLWLLAILAFFVVRALVRRRRTRRGAALATTPSDDEPGYPDA